MPELDNKKHESFCREYLVDMNGTQSAIRAGYSAKTANRIASQLLSKLDIKTRIKELRDEYYDDTIMSAKEAEALLAQIARGDMDEEVIIVVGEGEGISRPQRMMKQVDARSRLKALELIGRRNQLFTDKVAMDINIEPVTIIEDVPDER